MILLFPALLCYETSYDETTKQPTTHAKKFYVLWCVAACCDVLQCDAVTSNISHV